MTGVTSIEEAATVLETLRLQLEGIFQVARAPLELVIHNVVGVADVGTHLELEHLGMALDPQSFEYEPEQFPALVLSLEHGAKCLLFSSGKVVITGVATVPELHASFEDLKLILARTGYV